MTCRATLVLTLLAAHSAPAQDLPTTQLEDHGQVVRQGVLTRSLLRQRSGGRTSKVEARTTCANKARAAADFGASHPNVRRLYALCARSGY